MSAAASAAPRRASITPLGLAVALSLLGDLSLFAGLVTKLDATGLNLAEVGILLSVHRLVRIPGNVLVGLLQDRLGRRPCFLLGMLLAMLSTGAYGMVQGFWPFLLARVGWGAAWALINVSGATMVLERSAPGERGRQSGLYSTWVWTGYVLGPLAGGLLTDLFSFKSAMLVCAGLAALGLAVAVWGVTETRPTLHSGLRTGGARTWLAPLRSPVLSSTLVLFAVIQFAGDGVVLSTLTLLLTTRLGDVVSVGSWQLPAAAAGGIFIAGRGALAGFASLWAGRISDRQQGRLPLVWAGLLALAGGLAVLAAAASAEAVAVGLLFNALGGGTVLAVLPALVRDHCQADELAGVMGIYAMAGDTGSTAGPYTAFRMAAASGLQGVYGLCLALLAGGVLPLIIALRRKTR